MVVPVDIITQPHEAETCDDTVEYPWSRRHTVVEVRGVPFRTDLRLFGDQRGPLNIRHS